MKKNLLIGFVLLLSIQGIHAQTQMKKWYLNGKEIDFTQTNPVVKNMPASYSGARGAANGAYGPSGNLLFFIIDANIYNKYGALIGEIGNVFQGYPFEAEISIVPVPGSCSKYYVIYPKRVAISHKANFDPVDPQHSIVFQLFYSEIDLTLNNGMGGITSTKYDIALGGVFDWVKGGIAVTKLINNSFRFLYAVGKYDDGTGSSPGIIRRHTIHSGGINEVGVIIYQSTNNMGGAFTKEVELSPDGTKLAWANFSGGASNEDVMVASLSADGLSVTNVQTYDITSFGSRLTGVEFSPDNTKLFVGIEGVEVGVLDLAGSYDGIQNSDAYSNSQLELAYSATGQQILYAATSTSEIKAIDITDPANPFLEPAKDINTVNPSIVENFDAYFALVDILTLPDQIDGENYDDRFQGISTSCQCLLDFYNVYTHTVTGTTPITWTASSNPFGTSSIVKIDKALTIPANTELTISGMTIEFGSNAILTIESGAHLNLINSTLVESSGCSDDYYTVDVKANATLDVKSSGLIDLGSMSSISNKGIVIVRSGGKIETKENAILNNLNGGYTVVTNGGELFTHRGGKISVQQGGILEYQNSTANKGIVFGNQPTAQPEPYLEIAGNLIIPNNTTFTFTGNGYINWKNGNSATFGSGSKLTIIGTGKTDLVMKLDNSTIVNISAPIDIQNGKIEYQGNTSFKGSNTTVFLKNLYFAGSNNATGFHGDALASFRVEASDINYFNTGIFLENTGTVASLFINLAINTCSTGVNLDNLTKVAILSNITITGCETGVKGSNSDAVTLINVTGSSNTYGLDFSNTRQVGTQNLQLDGGAVSAVVLNEVKGFTMSGGRLHNYGGDAIEAVNSQVFLRGGATIDDNYSGGIHMVGSYNYTEGKYNAMVTIGDAGCGNIINNGSNAVYGSDFILNIDAIQHAVNRSTIPPPCKGCPIPVPVPYQVFPNRFYGNCFSSGNGKIFQICYTDQAVAPTEIPANGNFWGEFTGHNFQPNSNKFLITTKYNQYGNCNIPISVDVCQFIDNASFYGVTSCTQWNTFQSCRKSSGGKPDDLVSGPPEFKECPALVHKPDVKTIHESFQEANVQFIPDDNLQTRSNFKEISDLKLSKNNAGEIIICDINDPSCGNGGGGGGGGNPGEKISNPCAQLVIVAKVLYEPMQVQQRLANPENSQEEILQSETFSSPLGRLGGASQISIYPNPNDGTMTLAYSLTEGENGKFVIFDVTGRKISEYKLLSENKNLELSESNLATGIFYYQFSVDDSTIKIGKLIVLK